MKTKQIRQANISCEGAEVQRQTPAPSTAFVQGGDGFAEAVSMPASAAPLSIVEYKPPEILQSKPRDRANPQQRAKAQGEGRGIPGPTASPGGDGHAPKSASMRRADFERVCKEEYPRLLKEAKRQWPGSVDDCEDFVQEAVFETYEGLANLTEPTGDAACRASLALLLRRIVDRERKRTTRTAQTLELRDYARAASVGATSNDRLWRGMQPQIDGLPEPLAQVLYLRLHFHSLRSIGRIVGCDDHTVKAKLLQIEETIQAAILGCDEDAVDQDTFTELSQRATYHRPFAPWPRWTACRPGRLVITPFCIKQETAIDRAVLSNRPVPLHTLRGEYRDPRSADVVNAGRKTIALDAENVIKTASAKKNRRSRRLCKQIRA